MQGNGRGPEAFVRGNQYSRAEITAAGFGRSDLHAVLVMSGRPVAIVVTATGSNRFNGKKYLNVLSPAKFTTQGENDQRGRLLETPAALPLFFRRSDSGGYRYEGMVRDIGTTNYAGEPWREFERLAEPVE